MNRKTNRPIGSTKTERGNEYQFRGLVGPGCDKAAQRLIFHSPDLAKCLSSAESAVGQPINGDFRRYSASQLAVLAWQLISKNEGADDRKRPVGLGLSLSNESQLQVAMHTRDTTVVATARSRRLSPTSLAEDAVFEKLVEALDRGTAPPDFPNYDLEVGVASAEWIGVAARKVDCCVVNGSPVANPKLVFPGAFNPVHRAHRQMSDIASQIVGEPTVFELAISNVDKPPLDYLAIQKRVAQDFGGAAICLTNAAMFSEKARLFPGATFVVGADTIQRLGETRYYRGGLPELKEVVADFRRLGIRFLVFARRVDGRLLTLDSYRSPVPELVERCQQYPAEKFCDSISSSKLRGF